MTRDDALINRNPPTHTPRRNVGDICRMIRGFVGGTVVSFLGGGLPQFSRIIVVYVANKGHIHKYICNQIKPHAMTIKPHAMTIYVSHTNVSFFDLLTEFETGIKER